jgi:hypothetical protein
VTTSVNPKQSTETAHRLKSLRAVFLMSGIGCGLADDVPRTMLTDARGNKRGVPTSKNYTLNRPARAGVCAPFRIAHIEDKGRLPRGVTQDFGKQAGAQGGFSQRFFMIDHFH